MPWSDLFLAASVCRLLTALLNQVTLQHIAAEHTDDVARMYFAVAMAWGLGGLLNHEQRAEFSKALLPELRIVCKQLESLPSSATIYDITPDVTTLKLTTYDALVPKYAFESGLTVTNMFVPTLRTAANLHVLQTIAQVRLFRDSCICGYGRVSCETSFSQWCTHADCKSESFLMSTFPGRIRGSAFW